VTSAWGAALAGLKASQIAAEAAAGTTAAAAAARRKRGIRGGDLLDIACVMHCTSGGAARLPLDLIPL